MKKKMREMNNYDKAEFLRLALNKIKNKDNWTKGELARKANGEPVEPTSKEACKFCAEGEIKSIQIDFRSYDITDYNTFPFHQDLFEKSVGLDLPLYSFNDNADVGV